PGGSTGSDPGWNSRSGGKLVTFHPLHHEEYRVRALIRISLLTIPAVLALSAAPRSGDARTAGTVDPYWGRAYVLSFRSVDLLTDEADEQWGRRDARLVSGGILSDFPRWLRCQVGCIDLARAAHRPFLLSLHVHSGYGTGLVTYSDDLQRAEVG